MQIAVLSPGSNFISDMEKTEDMKDKEQSIIELQARWDKLLIANVFDALDRMGYPNQCLDLAIMPIFPGQHLAGKAITVKGGREPRLNEEIKEEDRGFSFYLTLKDLVFPGSVVVVECGGENFTGKFGEMTSWGLQQRGATGIVLDSYIRDRQGLGKIPNYSVCARGTSPIESLKRWRPLACNDPIAMPGTLTSQVRVNPGDWIVGGDDGVIIVPQEIANDVLMKAEELEAHEQGMREDLAAGMPFEKAFEKWGRA
jgi:4-hydroxy-4-methyl-2-oxoglutarate aldolase